MKTTCLALSLVLAAFACGGEPSGDRMNDMPMDAPPTGSMAMPGMDMLPAMRTWVDTVRTAEPDALRRLFIGHAPRVDTLLAAMATDMGRMGMAGDEAWRALEDSVRDDVATLSRLDGQALVLRARAHAGRLRRLMAQHEVMMTMEGM